jgi:DNA-binding CsgD family transcriptional regulator/tetratricopeptide (TPR) repeat protein
MSKTTEPATEQTTAAAHRHIIERPRLTRLLDEAPARVILLVAPAGYGKTTLARQWLASRPHAWYVASAASADVAALGIGLVEAAEKLAPGGPNRFRQWLHSRGTEDRALAADLLADDLAGWPAGAWLVIDDYQWLTPDAEEVINRLREIPKLRILITSRRRPLWSTARELLYGDLYELETAALAMSPDEANQVLAGLESGFTRDLIALADGWPAIIGLASFADLTKPLDSGVLPPALHAYVAEELYSSVESTVQRELAQLSLLPSPSTDLAQRFLGPKSSLALAEGHRVGFLAREGDEGRFSIHPLLRTFLQRKLRDLPAVQRLPILSDAVDLLIEEEEWQGAFEVVRAFKLHNLLDVLIEASLYDLLDRGLLDTLSTFVELSRRHGRDSALIDLAEAELAFGGGFHERSKDLAENAGIRLVDRPHLASKAFCRAGQSAYFADELGTATGHFVKARELASNDADERWAIWGLFLCAMEQEDDAALTLLHEFERSAGVSVDDLVRIRTGRLHLGSRLGTLSHGLSGAEAVAGVVGEARDPAVRTAFWHAYAGALRAAAAYKPALNATEKALEEISRFDLDFARAHVYVTQAGVYIGMAAYAPALDLLDEIGRIGTRTNDVFLQMNERMMRCRIFLLADDALSAVRITEVLWPHLSSSGQTAEFLACRALALGMVPEPQEDTFQILSDAERRSRENEAVALCTCVRALLTLDGDTTAAANTITSGFRTAMAKGVLDPLVFGFRLDGRLARLVNRTAPLRPALAELLAIVDEPFVAEGARSEGPAESLTPREREVVALLAQGKTNKEIATALFLTEGTVKVHVRHVLRKLGARTRTEAALYALRRQPRGAEVPRAQKRKFQQSDSSE